MIGRDRRLGLAPHKRAERKCGDATASADIRSTFVEDDEDDAVL
jgi:hypothetical protein